MTSDQEVMWNVLTNKAEYLAHEWGRELALLKGKRFHKAADYYLGFIVNNFGNEEAARIVKTWLNIYQLQMDPDKLDNFDSFHTKFGRYIADEVQNLKAY